MSTIGPVSPPQGALVPIVSSAAGGMPSNNKERQPPPPPNPQIRLDHKNGVGHVEFSDPQGRIIAETQFKLSFLA
jgi:hypothetical protein